jgi:lysophospholipase L1-like esterase/LysM repeat protein
MRTSAANRFSSFSIVSLTILLSLTGSFYASSDKPEMQKKHLFSFLEEKKAIDSYLDKISTSSSKYSFLKKDNNFIQNDSLGMTHFYSKLEALRQGKINRVNVVQVGDSHLQSGFIPGEVRLGLQGFFGDAGRGLVFPNKTVGTGEAYDISISTQGWKNGNSSSEIYTVKKGDTKLGIAHRYGRSLKSLNRLNPGLSSRKILKPGEKLVVRHSYQALPPGFCGYALKTNSNTNSITIKTRNDATYSQKFNMLSLVLDRTDSKLNISISDINGNILKKTTIDQLSYSTNTVPINWSELHNSVKINVNSLDGKNPAVILYGISLERTQLGIAYHSIGLNSAGFDRYNKTTRFFEQVSSLRPDLVIISLGTNDAMGTFRRNIFEQNLDKFISDLKKTLPNTDVLMTTPPDSYKVSQKGKVENQAIPQVRDMIRDKAVLKGLACWDLYDIMGGKGSMKKWVNSGFAQNDHKHFNAEGYREQGYLLRDSILQGYGAYVARLAK